MNVLSTRVRFLLALETALLLTVGATFTVLSRKLPFGGWWPVWLSGGVLAALVPAAYFAVFQRRAGRLRDARTLELDVEEIPKKDQHTYLGEGFVWGPAQTHTLQERMANPDLASQASKEQIAGDWDIHGIGGDRWGPLYISDRLLNQHIFLMGAPGSGKTR